MYLLRRPDVMLQDHIEHYWFVLDEAGENVDLRVEAFVDARADLIFNFGAPYRREVIGGSVRELADSNFDAQRLVPIRIEQRGRVRVGGVRFHLGGVAAFTKAHLADFSGSTSQPGAVFGADAVRLETELRPERDPDAATALLDAFFLDLLGRHGAHPGWSHALDTMRSSDGLAPLADVPDAAGVSARHLERLFARGLGFPPKTVARVLRFQHVLRRLMEDPEVPLGELATTVGYFDQPHFIKDFSQFTGGVPRGYRGYYPPGVPTDFAPNLVVFLQDFKDRPRQTDSQRHRHDGVEHGRSLVRHRDP